MTADEKWLGRLLMLVRAELACKINDGGAR